MEMGIWRRIERINGRVRVRNEKVLRTEGEDRQTNIVDHKKNWLGHVMTRECVFKTATEKIVKGVTGKGRKRYKMVEDINIGGKYKTTKGSAQDRPGGNQASVFIIQY